MTVSLPLSVDQYRRLTSAGPDIYIAGEQIERETCEECHGVGFDTEPIRPFHAQIVDCIRCDGAGSVPAHANITVPCETCEGAAWDWKRAADEDLLVDDPIDEYPCEAAGCNRGRSTVERVTISESWPLLALAGSVGTDPCVTIDTMTGPGGSVTHIYLWATPKDATDITALVLNPDAATPGQWMHKIERETGCSTPSR